MTVRAVQGPTWDVAALGRALRRAGASVDARGNRAVVVSNEATWASLGPAWPTVRVWQTGPTWEARRLRAQWLGR